MINNKTYFTAEEGKLDIVIRREFDAPREQVFRAFTDPDLYVQWLGPRKSTMILERFEPKSGGNWRYIHKDPDGNSYAFHGVFHEVKPPERMINTFEFEGLQQTGHVSLETAKFEEMTGGGTLLTVQTVFPSVGDRDGQIRSGMEEGISDSYDRLDELLERMKRKT